MAPSKKSWFVAPADSAANRRLGEFAASLSGDRYEEGVRCYNGARTITLNGWRFSDFSSEVKPILRNFLRREIRLFRFSEANPDGAEWRHNILKHLPRRQRYSRRLPSRRKSSKAA